MEEFEEENNQLCDQAIDLINIMHREFCISFDEHASRNETAATMTTMAVFASSLGIKPIISGGLTRASLTTGFGAMGMVMSAGGLIWEFSKFLNQYLKKRR